MKLSTGNVAFPLEFDNGDKAVIYFNPNDRGIQERIQGFEASVEKRIKEIDLEKYKNRYNDETTLSVGIDNIDELFEMSAEDLEMLRKKLGVINEIELEYNNAVKAELDAVFCSKISDTVFRYCQPFDTVVVEDENGNEKREMYIIHFIHWLATELKNYGIKNKSAIDKHISKYEK